MHKSRAMSHIAVSTSEIAGGTEQISASFQDQLSAINEVDAAAGQLSAMAEKL
ncbi:hypothetical protein QNH46_06025 [Paenibacillus woosongensis]|uniref:Methyl-accepting chemotaxis protein n=1 Tax=Paenibacillus woosongensis TaxID=307580 RepID=A0AA95I474_9BACL|nr:hypothetical protein [Paenibacillus woosongensis]WHX50219.1 hypothetical protein QNH46_06025 [Paenibacillus woosongensis]